MSIFEEEDGEFWIPEEDVDEMDDEAFVIDEEDEDDGRGQPFNPENFIN